MARHTWVVERKSRNGFWHLFDIHSTRKAANDYLRWHRSVEQNPPGNKDPEDFRVVKYAPEPSAEEEK